MYTLRLPKRTVSEHQRVSPKGVFILIETILQVFAVVSSMVGAFYWYLSSKQELPASLGVATYQTKDSFETDNPTKLWAKSVSQNNKLAALWTAGAVGFQGAAIMANLVASWLGQV